MLTTITTHTRKTDQGYISFVQITNGPMRVRQSTYITRRTRADAKHDAVRLKKDIEDRHIFP
jgi:hypothetical protein